MVEEKPHDKKRVFDIEELEKQARDLIESAEIPDLDSLEVPEGVRKRIDSADLKELEHLERELSEGFYTVPAALPVKNEGSAPDEPGNSAAGAGEEEPAAGEGSEGGCREPEENADGSFKVVVTEDGMRSCIDLVPSKGRGIPLTFERVKEKLMSMRIIFGVNEGLVKRLVDSVEKTKEQKSGVIIAQGTPPERGADGSIKFLFSESEEEIQWDTPPKDGASDG